MAGPESEGIVEIQSPDVDAEAIMERIREKLRARRKEAEAKGLDFYSLVEGEYPKRFDPKLYRSIRQMSTSVSQLGVSLSLSGKGALPILSSLSRRVRTAFHQLVIYYVNQLATQQDQHNRQVMRVLMELVRELERESHAEQIKALQDDVDSLREQVATLTTLAEADDG